MGAFAQELRHIANLMACFLRETITGTRQDGGTHEDGDIGEFRNQLLHQRQILGAIVFCRYVNLQEGNIDIAQVIMITLGRIADEQLTLGVVVFQPIFQGSTYEATSDNSNVNHISNYERPRRDLR